ncbi:MAG: hypothetical protein AAF386_00645 [Pseudomonadota bacterium]
MKWLLCLALPTVAWADAPAILDATAQQTGQTWQITVTLEHPDTGWDHFADGWQVRTTQGTVLAQRTLAHPHVNEQPFARSQSRIEIPADIDTVYIFAKDNLGVWTQTGWPLTLPQ